MRSIALDVLAGIGAVALLAGVYLTHPPSTLIVGGAGAIAIAVLAARSGGER